jgi:hypothetical protein
LVNQLEYRPFVPDLTLREVGLRLLAQDRDYLWRISHACIERPEASVWPLLCTLQHLALIGYEGRRYLAKVDPGQLPAGPLLEDDAVAASRHANKLFLDTERYVDGVAQHYGAISRQHHGAFFTARGVLSRSLDRFRDDIGIVRFRRRLIGTTHSVHYNSGLPPEAFGSFTTMGPRLGKIAQGLAAFAQPDSGSALQPMACWLGLLDACDFKASDMKSEKFYQGAFAGRLQPDMAAALASLQVACSTTQLLTGETPRLLDGSWPVPVFKIRYITVFQVLASLKYLTEQYGMELPGSVLSQSKAQEVLSPGGKALRNTLVHYGVRIPGVTTLPAGRPLFGLAEHFMAGLAYGELCTMVDDLLRELSEFLRGWSGIQ